MITYETLYETLMKEKSRKELQKLDKDFFQNTTNYLEEKNQIFKSQKNTSIFTTEAQKTEKQINNIKKIIQQLHEKRERKIIETAIIASRTNTTFQKLTTNMLQKEKTFFNNLLNIINKNKNEILIPLLNSKTPKKTKTLKSENSTTLIRFLWPIPKFLGTDEFTYGPFQKEDIANLPSKIANILIKKNRAEKIQT